MDDSALLQCYLDRIREGDLTARRSLLERSFERIRRLARMRLCDYPSLRAMVESGDIASAAYLRLDTALKAVAVPTLLDFIRLASWHIRCVLVDLARREMAHVHVPLEEQHEQATTVGDPAAMARWTELHEAIEALEPDDRDLFDLLYYQGLTQPEAATLLGRPLRTLKTHWRDAKIRLGTRLGDWIFDE
jgi:RNA polymerase sigma-70 factor (ECF subfamily)